MYTALVLGVLHVSLLFDDLSGHSYPSTFLVFLIIYSCSFCAKYHILFKSTVLLLLYADVILISMKQNAVHL